MSKRVALITGASGGIGQAIAHHLAREGITLQLHYHANEAKALTLQTELMARYNIDVTVHQANLAEEQGVDHLLSTLLPLPDILIHNAGQAQQRLFTDISSTDYQAFVQLHLTSPFQLTQAIVPHMVANRSGRIIFVTSIWGETGAACESLYAMVKGGATALMKSLALEFAPSNIMVNAVSPGVIDTDMNATLSPEEQSVLKEDIPYGRFGTPDEVAHAIQFLVQEKTTYVTGQTLRVNGGWHT
ncbi:elongation factor P 5-aminopentanone reductase [Caldalkalibacillus salinus]|uniref:elongation factor P 5-aminopentanone reductase n=1 Tax=Caldalkalibacillus salinus TaxID=2803787 RepID=UPI001922783E|nr:SDR family oxidoreductase [Caldalkalibacillus salinus]